MKFQNFKSVFLREWRRIFTSKDLLLICFAAPLAYGLAISYLYINKRASDINIGLINSDTSAVSRKLARSLNAAPELKITQYYGSSEQGYRGIFSNDVGAFYLIPRNFTANLKKGRPAVVFNASNASAFMISSAFLKKIAELAAQFPRREFEKTLIEKGYSRDAAKAAYEPLKADVRHIFNPQMNYSDFLLPCLLFIVLQQILLVAVCTTVLLERKPKNKRELSKASEGSFAAAFFGKAAPYVIIGTAINLANIFIMLPFVSIFTHSFAGLFALSTAFITAVVFFAMMISALFDSTEMALAALMFYSFPAAMLSGMTWPHAFLPLVLKIISYAFPSTYAVTHLRLFILGDVCAFYSLAPSALLAVFAAACFVLSYLARRRFIS
ncbi:MAG: ABC transporter permease [Endomicrobia bacterium]|nr:ABC transporter permease [Endomicrobiia bacterium]